MKEEDMFIWFVYLNLQMEMDILGFILMMIATNM